MKNVVEGHVKGHIGRGTTKYTKQSMIYSQWQIMTYKDGYIRNRAIKGKHVELQQTN